MQRCCNCRGVNYGGVVDAKMLQLQKCQLRRCYNYESITITKVSICEGVVVIEVSQL